MAILEALACSLPCLITTACHFPELAEAGGGIVVEPDETAVTQGLRDLLERSDRERRRFGQNGRRLVEASTPGTGRPSGSRRSTMARRREERRPSRVIA